MKRQKENSDSKRLTLFREALHGVLSGASRAVIQWIIEQMTS